jgi:KDO2-lipid IV(A) lauroyltransferase
VTIVKKAPARRKRIPLSKRIARSTPFHRFTASLFGGMWGLVRMLGPDRGPAVIGRGARLVAPLFGESRTGRANLAAVFPEKSEAERRAILDAAWENFVRTTSEMAVIRAIAEDDSRFEIIGLDVFRRMAADDRPGVLFTAHLGNWELLSALASRFGAPLTALYRAPSNPYVAEKILSQRGSAMGPLVANGRHAAQQLASSMKAGGHIGLLVDQRPGGGVPVTFLGRPAKANPLAAQMARLFDCPLAGGRCIRLPDGRFRVEIVSLEPARDQEGRIDVDETTRLVNAVVEGWVRDHPEQWLWMHDRWRP